MKIYYFFVILILIACQQRQKLPILGDKTYTNGDTLYHSIPDFSFTDQTGKTVTNATFSHKIYVADFFFTTCPTICPKMKTQLLRVYKQYKNNGAVGILSHSIDPDHDSVAVLRQYAQRLQIPDNKCWHFVTGNRQEIFKIGEHSYMVTAKADSSDTQNGGFIHSGAFILVDTKRRIRGMYDGTNEASVSKLLKDMQTLLDEK